MMVGLLLAALLQADPPGRAVGEERLVAGASDTLGGWSWRRLALCAPLAPSTPGSTAGCADLGPRSPSHASQGR